VRAATGRSASARRWLVASEVAIVVLLLTGAMLLVRTFVKLRNVDLGFDTEQVAEVETRWPIGTLFGSAGRGQQWPRVQRAVDGLLDALASIPGVQSIGIISDVPLASGPTEASVWRIDAPGAHDLNPPNDPAARWKTDVQVISPGYFPALRIPILRGRNFTAADRFTDRELVRADISRIGAVIVNATFASRYFPGQDPVGRRIVLPDLSTFAAVRTIVGVTADVRARAVAEAAGPTAYIPHSENPDVFRPSLVVRSAMPFRATASALRQRIAEYDPTLLVLRVRPMDDVVSGALSRPRFNLLLLSSFALVALALAAIGIYGVLAYLVTERTREIGIRVALGARPNDVLGLVLREGMRPVAAGACAGTAASLLTARAIRTLLFGVTPVDAVSLAGAPVLLAAVALIACYLPARRALAVDPIVALRDE
jgi:predicted permease